MRKNKISGIISVYGDLIKYKLSLAVTFSSVTGYFIYHDTFEISLLYLISGVFFLASGAGALNQYSEIKYDALMFRTNQRPLPLNKISPQNALLVVFCLFFPGLFFLSKTGIIPMLLGIVNVILYNVAYTKLKRVTSLAIIPGALVGAVPPLIGYEAAGGTMPGYEIILFSGFMFLWQLPHFWLILLKYDKEYKNAGFITLSDIMSTRQVKILVFLWVALSTLLILFFSIAGIIFYRQISVVLIPLNVLFIFVFHYLLFRKPDVGELGGAFILVNSFSLMIMILFIINSFLS